FDHRVVLRRGATSVIMQHVQAAERVHGGANGGLEARFVGDVGADGDGAIASQMRGLLACRGGDVRHHYPGAFTREQHRCGTANTRARASDEGHLACKSCHTVLLSRSSERTGTEDTSTA